jgi:hypothetical protein
LKAPLNFLERLGIDDGRMLPRPGSPVVVDLAEIMPVAQDVGERAIGQMNAANRLAGRQRTNPGPDVSPLQLALQRANRSELEIEIEDQPHGRGLTLIDIKLSLCEPIAERHNPAHP